MNEKGYIKNADFKVKIVFLKESVAIILSYKNSEGISVEEKTLVDSLNRLAEEINKVSFNDSIWNDKRIK